MIKFQILAPSFLITLPPWLRTPAKVQQLQRTLYGKAKGNRQWRAWSLYGELCRRDVLATALEAVVRNSGAAGVDGIGVAAIKADRETFLATLQSQLREKSYRPGPVLRVWIPKDDGKQRPLGIPTVQDRIVQMALLILLQPIFEADFHEASYGYRPGKNAQLKWTPKTGQDGSINQASKTDPHVQKTTSA